MGIYNHISTMAYLIRTLSVIRLYMITLFGNSGELFNKNLLR